MRRHTLLAAACVLGLLSLYLFWQEACAIKELEYAGDTVSVVCRTDVPAQEAWELLRQPQEDSEEEVFCPVFWMERDEVQVSSKLLGNQADVRVICAAGNTELLFPGGSALASGDTEGCLIDRDTARALFGYGEAAGQILLLEDKEYEIRGTVEGHMGILVIQTAENADIGFDTVTVPAGGKQQEEIRELLEGRYGIQGTVVEWNLLYGLAKLVLLVFPMSVAAAVLISVRKNIREASGRGERIFWRLCFWAGVLGSLYCIAAQVHLPSDMIPSTWSDFDFWSNIWEEKRLAVSFLLEMKKRTPEIPYMNAFYKSVILGFLSLLLYFPALLCYTHNREL